MTETVKPVINRVRVCDCPMGVRTDQLDTRPGQVAALSPFIEAACIDVFENIGRLLDYDKLVGRAVACISEGYTLHGRQLFDMPDWKLEYEFAREVEDAIVYRAEQLRRKAGTDSFNGAVKARQESGWRGVTMHNNVAGSEA